MTLRLEVFYILFQFKKQNQKKKSALVSLLQRYFSFIHHSVPLLTSSTSSQTQDFSETSVLIQIDAKHAGRHLCLDTPASPSQRAARLVVSPLADRSHDCVCTICLTPAEWTEAFQQDPAAVTLVWPGLAEAPPVWEDSLHPPTTTTTPV